MSQSFKTGLPAAKRFADASIAFDLDGTLVDTAPDLVRALNEVVRPHGINEVNLDDVRAMVGRGSRHLIERAFARECQPLTEPLTDELVAAFIATYKNDIAARSTIFPGVVETLQQMKSAGATLSVCTNKPSALSDKLLDTLDLTRFFDRVIGPERTQAKKPAADHVHSALGDDYAVAGMVGDSAPDVDSARAAGIPSIVLSYGYSENPVSSLGADRIVHAFSDVPKVLAELWHTGGKPGAD
jgi:phosphoglycolate phosphatase